MMELEEARCLLCFSPVAPGENYLVVRLGDPADGRLVTPENRSGVIHLRHLQNVFDPNMIDVQVAQYQMGPGFDIKVRVQL